MTNASTRKSAAAAKRSPLTLAGVGHGLQGWLIRNKFYIIAFFIPVALTYLAYALFGISPFGEESVLCLDLNGQYVYYFESLRDAFWGDGSIFYNWSRNLSGNFMGIIGYADCYVAAGKMDSCQPADYAALQTWCSWCDIQLLSPEAERSQCSARSAVLQHVCNDGIRCDTAD